MKPPTVINNTITPIKIKVAIFGAIERPAPLLEVVVGRFNEIVISPMSELNVVVTKVLDGRDVSVDVDVGIAVNEINVLDSSSSSSQTTSPSSSWRTMSLRAVEFENGGVASNVVVGVEVVLGVLNMLAGAMEGEGVAGSEFEDVGSTSDPAKSVKLPAVLTDDKVVGIL